MTNQTVRNLLDYLCNEARNSVHASFGLLALCPSLIPDPGWQTCLDSSKSSADRLLRSIDDIRELLATEPATLSPAEEFDLTLSLGEIIEFRLSAFRIGFSRRRESRYARCMILRSQFRKGRPGM